MPEQHAPVQESARAAAPAAALPLLRSEAVRHPRPVAAAGQTRVLYTPLFTEHGVIRKIFLSKNI